MTATTVATVPSKVPCIHCSALTITPEPWGSVERSWAKAEVESRKKLMAAIGPFVMLPRCMLILRHSMSAFLIET